MSPRGLAVLLLLAVPAAGQGKSKSAPAPASSPSGAEEVYRLGREALARGSFDAAGRLFRALEDDPAIGGTSGYAFNRAQAARFLASAGEAVYWYGRYLALTPAAPDAATVRELIAKLAASYPKTVRAEALRRARLEWERALDDPELERALRACPEARLEVRFAREGAVLGEGAFVFPARAVFWELPENGPGTLWVVPTAPVAPGEDLGGPPLLILPPGRALAVPVGPDLVSPPVTLSASAPGGFPADPALAAWRVEVTARVDRSGPPVQFVARRTTQALVELRSGAADGPLLLGKKRRDAPPEPMTLAFGPRDARPDSRNAPKGLLAPVAIPGREGTLEPWAVPLSIVDVVNRFWRKTLEGGETRLWVRPDATGPFLAAFGP